MDESDSIEDRFAADSESNYRPSYLNITDTDDDVATTEERRVRFL